MPRNGSMNMEDPAVQEKIRRDTHEYIPIAGKHGSYLPVAGGYRHAEYPKMMLQTPKPDPKNFKGRQEELEAAVKEWDDEMQASVVNSRTEEMAWIEAHPDYVPPKKAPVAAANCDLHGCDVEGPHTHRAQQSTAPVESQTKRSKRKPARVAA